MENEIVLEVKTRDITTHTVQNTARVFEEKQGQVQVTGECKDKNALLVEERNGNAQLIGQEQGTLTIMGTVPNVQDFITAHNLDPHAHKKLWYIHEQGVAANVWEVQHNLDRLPSVTVVDTADNVVMGYVTYIDSNNIRITFNAPFKGKAYIN